MSLWSRPIRFALVGLAALALPVTASAQMSAADSARLERLKAEALAKVDPKLVQEIVDQLFSFSELGMQEFETQRYITRLLRSKGIPA